MNEILSPNNGKWYDKGIVFRSKNINMQTFTSCAEPLDDENWRIWYSSSIGDAGNENFNIGFLEGLPGQTMRKTQAVLCSGKAPEGVLSIGNLPEGWHPRQAVHIVMPDGSHRLYFWAHCHKQGVVRFLCACSSNGLSYEVIDPYRPCFWHYNDRAANTGSLGPAGLTFFSNRNHPKPDFEIESTPGMLCNDATNVYLLPDGSFELYTAVIFPVPEDDPRYIVHDNAAGWVRVIERRTSQDGITWSRGTTILEPDADDPDDLQFYYLAANNTTEGRVGILGRYLVKAQTMDIEWCFSENGVNWSRPERKAWLPRTPELLGVYAPHAMIFHNNCWYMFYTGCNYTHNLAECTESERISDIRMAVFK